ncbi:MAG: hypothetical protein ACR2MD_11560 [Aridibacter sp.]
MNLNTYFFIGFKDIGSTTSDLKKFSKFYIEIYVTILEASVTKSVPDYAVAFGISAKVIRLRKY